MRVLSELIDIGYRVSLRGDSLSLIYCGNGEPPVEKVKPLLAELKAQKAEAIAYLRRSLPRPYLETDGNLVIPFESDGRFHWWAGGQTVSKTMQEVKKWDYPLH